MIKETGDKYSLMFWMGRTPQQYISAFEFAKDGNTRPGQSTRQMSLASSSRRSVWKCFVFPGIAATPTLFLPHKTLMREDFPTFGYPTVPTMRRSSWFLEYILALAFKTPMIFSLVKISVLLIANTYSFFSSGFLTSSFYISFNSFSISIFFLRSSNIGTNSSSSSLSPSESD